MKYGYQTIIFGPAIDDLSNVLKVIKAVGFQGVEFSQPPSAIAERGKALSFEELCKIVSEEGLMLLGFAGGSLATRMRYCGDPHLFPQPLYLYVDQDQEEDIDRALAAGYTVALHPHVFRPIDSMVDIRSIVDKRPNQKIFLIPDTAHMYMRGTDMVVEIANTLDRAIAVHLKDWTSAYGYSPLRYAKGFLPLGEGEVPVSEVLSLLKEKKYPGWIVAEQDYTRGDIATAVRASARYLGIAASDSHATYNHSTAAYDDRLLTAVLDGQSRSWGECQDILTKAILDVSRALSVSISACGASLHDLILLSHRSADPTVPLPEILRCDINETFIGDMVDENVPYSFLIDYEKTTPAKFQWVEYARLIGATYGVAIPVPLKYNPHYVNLSILLLFESERPNFVKLYAAQIASVVAVASAVALEEDSSKAAGQISALAQKSIQLKVFLNDLVKKICDIVGCEGCTIFLTSIANDRLVESATTGIVWNSKRSNHDYRPTDSGHTTTECWLGTKPVLFNDSTARGSGRRSIGDAISREVVSSTEDALLLTPIRGISGSKQGTQPSTVIGVVRCRNKKVTASRRGGSIARNVFSEDDLAILDAICHIAAPYIDMRRTYEDRLQGISRVTHEIKTPVNAIRQEVHFTQEMTRRYAYRYLSDDVVHDLEKSFEDVYALTDVAVNYVDNWRLYGFGGSVQRKLTYVGLIGDVIAPARDQVQFLLAENGFTPEGITYPAIVGPRDPIPKLYLDKGQFQQVFFNLFSNAIKYALPSKAAFEVKVSIETKPDGFYIYVQDNGVGIVNDYVDEVFEEGIRGPQGQADHIPGTGIGLYVVRQVIEGHGGTVRIPPGKTSNPTTVEIVLPRSLEWTR